MTEIIEIPQPSSETYEGVVKNVEPNLVLGCLTLDINGRERRLDLPNGVVFIGSNSHADVIGCKVRYTHTRTKDNYSEVHEVEVLDGPPKLKGLKFKREQEGPKGSYGPPYRGDEQIGWKEYSALISEIPTDNPTVIDLRSIKPSPESNL